MPVEGIIVNYNDGHSAEAICEMFASLDLDDVKGIIAYA
jgi:uncharacterized protein (DUF433 family)